MDYEKVEIALMPHKGTRGYDLSYTDNIRTLVGPNDGWLMPSHVGLNLEDNKSDDVISYLPLKNLIKALGQFIKNGGQVDYSVEEENG